MKKNIKRKSNYNKILIIIVLAILIIALFEVLKNKNTKIEDIDVNSNEIVAENIDTFDKEENIIQEVVEEKKSKLEEKLASGKLLSAEGLPVLMYHFFYDKSKSTGKDGNYIEIGTFEEQIKYLAENDFYFPTWQEVEDYIDEKQELPEKSVVITVDDGDPSFFELAVPILQKYDIAATSFVITYWYGDRANDKQKNVDYQSHSYDMHKAGAGGKGVMLSWDYEEIKKDVLLSQEVLGGANIFCYPFGQYNDLDIKVLKDSGYKLAFTTKAGRVKKKSSKYELPRVRISGDTTFASFKSKVD